MDHSQKARLFRRRARPAGGRQSVTGHLDQFSLLRQRALRSNSITVSFNSREGGGSGFRAGC